VTHPPGPLTLALRHALGEADAPDLSGADPTDFVAGALRQRLAVALAPHLADTGLAPEAQERLRARAAAERMAALQCAAGTVECVAAITDAGVRVLAIKGVALAALTTGDLAARGAGDIDLWVSPGDVPRAAEALAERGYSGAAPLLRHSSRLRYRQWSHFEATLVRERSVVDLHWRLHNSSHVLPVFDEAWDRREEVVVGGRRLATMGRGDSALHSCTHALADGWRWQRSLVDIHRLLAVVPGVEGQRLKRSRAVRLAAAITHDLTGGAHLRALAAPPSRALERERRTAAEQQAVVRWNPTDDIDPMATWRRLRQQLVLSAAPDDVARIVAVWALSPTALCDPQSGEDITLAEAGADRLRGVVARVSRTSG